MLKPEFFALSIDFLIILLFKLDNLFFVFFNESFVIVGKGLILLNK